MHQSIRAGHVGSYVRLFAVIWVLCWHPFNALGAQTPPGEQEKVLFDTERLWKAGSPIQALDRVRHGILQFPESWELYFLQGSILTTIRQPEHAVRSFDGALEAAPNVLAPRWAKWSLRTRQGKPELAIQELRGLAQHDPSNPLIHLRLAKDLQERDHLEEAVDAYQRAIQLVPALPGWRLARARVLYDLLDYQAARHEVQSVLARPSLGSNLQRAAHNLLLVINGATTDKGRRSQPFPHAQPASANGKRWALSREAAWRLMKAGQYGDAEPILREVLKLRPTDHRAAYDLGKTLMALDRYNEAINFFQKGITLSPSGDIYPDSIFRIGQCLAKFDRWTEALTYFERLQAVASWRQEAEYSMTFPSEADVVSWANRAREQVASHQDSPRENIQLPLVGSDIVQTLAPSEGPMSAPINFNPIELPGRVALMGRDTQSSWFQFVIPAGAVMRDDLQAGNHEFIPIRPRDTFRSMQEEIYLVFGLTTASYDDIVLTAEGRLETTDTGSDETPIARDQVVVTANEQSGFFVLSAPESGWTAGLYRVDLFVGEMVSAYTQADEVRFRIIDASSSGSR